MLVMVGNNGCGKTHCARAVHAWASKIVHHPKTPLKDGSLPWSKFVNWQVILDSVKQHAQWDLFDELVDAPLLVLDDIGAAHDPSGMGTDKLCSILGQRENKWTIITTNILPEHWEEKFDRRVLSRLFRNSVIVDLSEVPDYNA